MRQPVANRWGLSLSGASCSRWCLPYSLSRRCIHISLAKENTLNLVMPLLSLRHLKRNWYMKVRSLFVFSFSILFFSYSSQAQELITLEEAVAIALEKNYDVQLAKNTASVASTNQEYAWPMLLPQVNATGGMVWNDNNQKLEFQDASRNNSGKAKSQNTTASVQLNWLLFDGTRMFATLDRINTIDAQGALIVKDQMINTIATVINT